MALPKLLYLDSARLGLLSPSARAVLVEFGQLLADDCSSLYLEDFFFSGRPHPLLSKHAALSRWSGTGHLRERLLQIAGAPQNFRCLFAQRTGQLMRLAARLLYSRCQNVLTVDLAWPPFVSLLTAEAKRTGRTISRAKLRTEILRNKATREDVIELVSNEFHKRHCDGLFVPAVSHCGIRIPIGLLVNAITAKSEIKFVVTDAAQGLGHTPLSSTVKSSDFVVSGTHKWMGGYLPLGIGLYPDKHENLICAAGKSMKRGAWPDDPLYAAVGSESQNGFAEIKETLNLMPLVAAAGACHDFRERNQPRIFRQRLHNRECITESALGTAWRPISLADKLQTGILLLKSLVASVRADAPVLVRRKFLEHGISLTAYQNGLIRMSMPEHSLQPVELEKIRAAFTAIR